MPKKWDPRSFQDVVARISGSSGDRINSLLLMLQVTGPKSCPAPLWDPHGNYRVNLVGNVPTIERMKDGEWIAAPIENTRAIADTTLKPPRSETMATIQIFISHSAKDAELAHALVRCLEACLEVPDGAIRCTSVDGYRLDPGSDGNEALRRGLEQCSVVIGLLTHESLQSGYVIMELGAAWGLRKTTCPLLASGVDFGKIPGPLATTHAIKVDRGADIAQLMDVVAANANLVARNRARFTAAVQTFVETAHRPS